MSRYLDMVDHPSHVKKLTLDQLNTLAAEVRHDLITKLAKNLTAFKAYEMGSGVGGVEADCREWTRLILALIHMPRFGGHARAGGSQRGHSPRVGRRGRRPI